MRVPYSKMHGTGNLILVVDQCRDNLPPPDVELLRRLSDESTGPGFDQLMWLGPANDEESIASYRVFNADGSEVEQCGNGVRCVAKYLYDKNSVNAEFTLQSPAGPVTAKVIADGNVAVSMGKPSFTGGESIALTVAGETFTVGVVSMGNPHCVLQVNDVATARVAELGAKIEHHEDFPERINVGFMQLVDRQTIHLRVHERGVGETRGCGTGACAAVAYGQRIGLLADDVCVHLPGGQVVVSWRGGDTMAWLKGNAVLIRQGTVDLEE